MVNTRIVAGIPVPPVRTIAGVVQPIDTLNPSQLHYGTVGTVMTQVKEVAMKPLFLGIPLIVVALAIGTIVYLKKTNKI